MKKISRLFCITLLAALSLPLHATAATEEGLRPDSVRELYNGVGFSSYSLPSDSAYGLQKFWTVEFDPTQRDLYFHVVCGSDYANRLNTVSKTVQTFAKNHPELTPVAAVNGDLWMTGYAHSRVEGSGTSYLGYSDAVVRRELTVPRGFNMYGGEIITSTHIPQETPYEGDFYSFGMTGSGVAVIGNPQVEVSVQNRTSGSRSLSADGINRLPADNAMILYTDRGCASNYALSDAYEVIIDCPEDYTVCHGAVLAGTVTAVSAPGTAREGMKQNRLILTARGSRLDALSGFSVGDQVEIRVSVSDKMGNSGLWQKVTEAVGGHLPIILNGVSTGLTETTNYPSSMIGIRQNGNVVLITNDGRQAGHSTGFRISQLDALCKELGLIDAFLLDGGGSAEMVTVSGGSCTVVNRPSDGQERTVVNTVILSYGAPHGTEPQTVVRFDSEAVRNRLLDAYHVRCDGSANTLRMTLTEKRTPWASVGYPGGGLNLAKYPYVVVTAACDSAMTEHNQMKLCFLTAPGSEVLQAPGKTVSFTAGEGMRARMLDCSLDRNWKGELYGFRFQLFDYYGVGTVGESVEIEEIAFFASRDEAEAYCRQINLQKTSAADTEQTEPPKGPAETPAGCQSAFSVGLPCLAFAAVCVAGAAGAVGRKYRIKRRSDEK